MADDRLVDVPPVLDVAFDSGALPVLRAEVRARARQAGLPEERAADVVLALHELAANSVRHGGGKGRLRIWDLAGTLRCQVDDGDLITSGDPAALTSSLPVVPGHGLWVVQQVADQMQVLSESRGTCVRLAFDLLTVE